MTENSRKARSETLAKGLRILDFIGSKNDPASLREVAAALGMTKPTAHRLLATLADHGLIRFDSADARYRLGMRLFELSRQVWRDLDLRGAALPEMRKLHETTGETISLAVLTGDGAVYVDEIQSRHHLRERSRVGQRVAMRRSAVGKALASGFDRDERRRLRSCDAEDVAGRGEIPDPQALDRHLDLVNARGYALEVDEDVVGISGVAAPIADSRGVAVAAIGLSGAGERLDRDVLHRLGSSVIEATRRASLAAGGSPRPVSSAGPPPGRAEAPWTPLASVGNLIGESPVLGHDRRSLLWVDICRPCIFRLELAGGETRAYPQEEMATALADLPEGLLVAGQSGIRLIDPESGALLRDLGHPEAGNPANRFNDGKLDSRGRFWVGTLAFSLARGAGSLYRVSMDGDVRVAERNLTLPNGIGWSPDDRRMYLVESSDRRIYEYAYDASTGEIGDRKVLIAFAEDEPGSPDGLLVDEAGSLWVAMWDGWSILRIEPDGRVAERLGVPFPRPTSLVQLPGAPRKLAVTSARIRVSEALLAEFPEAGNVISLELPQA